jgi:hypothetical protein
MMPGDWNGGRAGCPAWSGVPLKGNRPATFPPPGEHHTHHGFRRLILAPTFGQPDVEAVGHVANKVNRRRPPVFLPRPEGAWGNTKQNGGIPAVQLVPPAEQPQNLAWLDAAHDGGKMAASGCRVNADTVFLERLSSYTLK